MNSLLLPVLFAIISLALGSNRNPAHLKPLGSTGSLVNIEALSGQYPDVSALFTRHIAKSEPIVSRQVLNNDQHYTKWQTDEQLAEGDYGLSETSIQVNSFKSRQQGRVAMPFTDFLKRFPKEPLMFADKVPQVLQ